MSHFWNWIANFLQTKLSTLNYLISINIRLFFYYSMHIYLKATLIKNYIGKNLYNNGNKKVNIYIYVYILRIF